MDEAYTCTSTMLLLAYMCTSVYEPYDAYIILSVKMKYKIFTILLIHIK